MIFRDWWETISDDSDLMKGILVGIVVVIVIGVGLWLSFEDDQEWQQYSVSHHCQAKGTKKGELEPVAGGKGGVAIGQDQTIYVCDGGEIVIR